MKHLVLLLALPLVLLGLERVNLIKDHNFEDNSDAWKYHAKTRTGIDLGANAVSRHDSTKAFSGLFSAYCDTRIAPSPQEVDSAVVMQGFQMSKIVNDLDSLIVHYSVIPIIIDKDYYYNWLHTASITLCITDPNNASYRVATYKLKSSDLDTTPPSWAKALDVIDFDKDTLWHSLTRALGYDLSQAGFSDEAIIDTFVLLEWGAYFPPWRAQKIYWDDIRLTGYADYDVGVKDLLSPDSIGSSESSGESLRNSPGAGYIPTARIKNFGRKAADSFLVIATIEGGAGVVYADTLTWSLTADTEDTVSFKEFKPSEDANYTLSVSTIMTPDESDEDDAMSKPLYGSGITEAPSPSLILDVARNTPSSLRVSYTLPLGEQGTISLYDPTGRRIESLKVVGEGSVSLKSGLSSGVYFVKLESGKVSVTRKAVILK